MKTTSYLKYPEYLEYLSFIEKCSTKTYDPELTIHKHHVYPKCIMKLTLESDSKYFRLVNLSVDDHIEAHILMSRCFEEGSYEYLSNLRAARLLSKKSLKFKQEIDKLYEYQKGDNNPAKRIEVRQKISNSLIGRPNKHKGMTYEEIYGTKSDEQRLKRKKRTRSDLSYKDGATKAKMTKTLNGISTSGDKNGFAKPMYIDGIYYQSVSDACSKLNVSRYILHKHFNISYIK